MIRKEYIKGEIEFISFKKEIIVKDLIMTGCSYIAQNILCLFKEATKEQIQKDIEIIKKYDSNFLFWEFVNEYRKSHRWDCRLSFNEDEKDYIATKAFMLFIKSFREEGALDKERDS